MGFVQFNMIFCPVKFHYHDMKEKIAKTDDTLRKTVIKQDFLGLKINGFHHFQVNFVSEETLHCSLISINILIF